MNERQGKNNAALHDALYQQISSSSDEAIKVALGLVDEADKAAQKMVAECETLLAAVSQGTEQIRSELREKMVEFATVMRVCVPKIRFCNIGDEGRRGQAV